MKFTRTEINRALSRIEGVVRPPETCEGILEKYRGAWVARIRLRDLANPRYPGDLVILHTKKGKKKRSRLTGLLTAWNEYDEEEYMEHNRAMVALWSITDDYTGFMQVWISYLSGLIIARNGAGRKMVVSELMEKGDYTAKQSRGILRIIEWLITEARD